MMSVHRMIPFVLIVVLLLSTACSGIDSTKTPSPQGSAPSGSISVTRGGQLLGTHATADEAFARASKEAGFQVLPVRHLPEGFQINSIEVLNPPAGAKAPLRQVQIRIHSDSGRAMISELNTRADPGPDAVPISASNPGDYVASPHPMTYTRVTKDRTYTLALLSPSLSQAEAIVVLNSIR